jgi:hypothetical protein
MLKEVKCELEALQQEANLSHVGAAVGEIWQPVCQFGREI